MACWANRCAREARDPSLAYCDEHWISNARRVEEVVARIGKDARFVYVGRTGHPERRLLEHFANADRDHLAVLHWSCHAKETIAFEDHLIKFVTRRFPMKKDNEGLTTRGRWASHWNALYVSWRWRDGRGRGIGAVDVRDLAGPSLVPRADDQFEPLFLRAKTVSRQGAKEQVKSWYANRRTLQDS